MTIALGPLEERLALFAEGIAGRYFHVKPAREFAGRRAVLGAETGTLTADAIYLPEELDAPDAASYRVLALQQLCHRGFGTYEFRFATAVGRIPDLAGRPPPSLGARASDFARYYHLFRHPALVSRLFHVCEQVRVDALMAAAYPGIRRHLIRWYAHLLAAAPPVPIYDLGSVLHALDCQAWGADLHLLAALDATELLPRASEWLRAIADGPADVYQSASVAARLHDLLTGLIDGARSEAVLPRREEDADPANWVQREARLEDWQEELAALDATLAVESLEGRQAEVAEAENLAGEARPQGVALERVHDQRDTLARRVDMERSAIRDALGTSPADARSFRYDEWNYLEHRYLPRWCRVLEQRLLPDPGADLTTLQAVIRAHRPSVQKRLERIKPLGYQRVFRLADGDELDFNALIQARQDIRTGHDPDERVYSRRDRVHRDVCAVFLVDLSASTDDPVEPLPPGPPPLEDDPFLWGRAAPDAGAASSGTGAPQRAAEAFSEPRRIIDVQREAMLVMSAALEQLGDSYGVYGFSGYGRDCVELFVVKEPDERFDRNTLAAIGGMKPKRSTRMGPAIRHAVRKLIGFGNALKVLIIVSDGFPQDCDYGPERGEHEYGVQDTARALQEAHDKGVETFCVTVDRSGHDYLKRMAPDARYLVIEDVEDLPEQLTKVYEALTG